ncbi:hypothetical protein [Uliginosibacterium aquaticum]|uniref:hypothetical protein n=1 Tax=Uliginosibacterium aquaticum TaxID=2731212 RepID=UPI001F1EFAF2|nr:hypothetical protein [Uliginosibacterium aquaticum]
MPARSNTPDTVVGDLRRSIAHQAARLIAEEGIEDYAFAKRKAARQLGVPERDLPSNAEIEGALREWRTIFSDEDDAERLQQMRAAALVVLRLLTPFRPYVTGAVIDGMVDAFSEVEVEVYADSAKDVEIYLLGRDVPYEHQEVRSTGHDAPEAILVFDCDEVPVKLYVHNHVAERTPRRNHAGAIQEKLRLDAFEALLGLQK